MPGAGAGASRLTHIAARRSTLARAGRLWEPLRFHVLPQRPRTTVQACSWRRRLAACTGMNFTHRQTQFPRQLARRRRVPDAAALARAYVGRRIDGSRRMAERQAASIEANPSFATTDAPG